jgi:hypothetical protein
MTKVRVGHVAGVSLTLLLAGAAVLEAQERKPRLPTRIGVPGQPAPGQPAGAQVGDVATQMVKPLLRCCVVHEVDQTSGTLVVRNTATGALHRVKVPGVKVAAVGARTAVTRDVPGQPKRHRAAASKSKRYRPGQLVEMNLDGTAMAITPFPVKDSKESKVKRSSWKMWTDVTVSNDGRISGRTRTKSSEAMRGFTGGVEVFLVDGQNIPVHQTKLRTYGVNGTAMGGKSDRTETWSETAPIESINKVKALVIYHRHEPKVKWAAALDWIKDNKVLMVKVYKCVKTMFPEDEEETAQGPPPPPPPGGQDEALPPSGDTSMLECGEAGAELLKQLGY